MFTRKVIQPVEAMKKISRRELPEKLDEILDIIDRDHVGYVITDEDKHDLVLCPADWFDYCFDDDFGCILNSAVRYALGRNTYMPDTVAQYVSRYLPVLDSRTIVVMLRDLEEALQGGDFPYRETWALLKVKLEARLEELGKGAKNG